jgi:hypothetical protein
MIAQPSVYSASAPGMVVIPLMTRDVDPVSFGCREYYLKPRISFNIYSTVVLYLNSKIFTEVNYLAQDKDK